MIGIYVITNVANLKVYVGQSIDIRRRWTEHLLTLKRGKHFNKHLQGAYAKYGKDSFIFTIVEECERKQLDDRELFWINKFNSTDNKHGYNIIEVPVTVKQTDQTRRKISESRRGMRFSKSHREHIREARIGRKATEKTKAKLRALHSNSPVGEEAYNARISNRDATAICEMLQAGKKICEISKITRISYGIIKAIKHRRSWLSISSNFSF